MPQLNNLFYDTLPYEKCLRYGAHALSNQELLAVMIRTGTKRYNCMEIADQILKAAGPFGLLGLKKMSILELTQIEGIGSVKAVNLACIGELSDRISKTSFPDFPDFSNSEQIARYYMESMRHQDKEQFLLLMLNTKCRLIHETVLSVGTVNFTCVSSREIFKEALRHSAVYLIMLHNHPSGDPSPSNDDINTTRRITEAGTLIGIPLLDHIIIGDNTYVSMKEKKLI